MSDTPRTDAKAFGFRRQTVGAVESAVEWAKTLERELTAERERRVRAEERIARLEGRMCLVCGKDKPCTETPDACTFDPDPITAAKEFLERAWKAEDELAAAKEPVAWLLIYKGATLHISKEDGWNVKTVITSP